MENVECFQHLRSLLISSDPDWAAVQENLIKYKSIRKIISQLLMREGDNPMMICNFYKVVTQSVLMNGLDTWALMGILLGILEWMHWGVAQMIFLMGGRYFTGTWGHITTL